MELIDTKYGPLEADKLKCNHIEKHTPGIITHSWQWFYIPSGELVREDTFINPTRFSSLGA